MTDNEEMDSKNTKMEKVVLNRKQLCAGIKFLDDFTLSFLEKEFLKKIGFNTKKIEMAVILNQIFDQMIKDTWQGFTDDDEINVAFEIPDLEEDGGNNHD